MILTLLLVATAALLYPPTRSMLTQSWESPNQTFRLEMYSRKSAGGGLDGSIWLVASDNRYSRQLIAPGVLTLLYPIGISISPDEHWIMWEQKLYHGANAAGLFERVSGLTYTERGRPIFSEAAWRFMSQQTHHPFKTDYIHMLRISDWPVAGSRVRHIALYGGTAETAVTTPNDHSLLLSLSGDDQETSVTFWFCYYDLAKRQFYLDAALEAHNHDSIGPWRDQGHNPATQLTPECPVAPLSMTRSSSVVVTRPFPRDS
jgi:hypothetical protein